LGDEKDGQWAAMSGKSTESSMVQKMVETKDGEKVDMKVLMQAGEWVAKTGVLKGNEMAD